MRKCLAFLALLGALVLPLSVSAQSGIELGSLQVQLWPEYDQPSMLVIYDFTVAEGISLPASVVIRIPADAHLLAVAYTQNGGLMQSSDYTGPVKQEEWQAVTVKVSLATAYHLEYYEPLTKTNANRQFTYLWPADYAVDNFSLSVRMPEDTTQMTIDPALEQAQASDGTTHFQKNFGSLAADQQFTLNLSYTKTSDRLSVPAQNVQPSEPVGPGTPGRVMFSNYLPYILGGLGLLLIIGGGVYYWQSGHARGSKPRKRHSSPTDEFSDSDVYCHQCGTRAKSGDRFCRVCGTRLRQEP